MQITLRAARMNRGYKLKDIAKITGKSESTIMKYEKDSTNIPRNLMLILLTLYGVDVDDIFFGKESDFIEQFKKSIAI